MNTWLFFTTDIGVSAICRPNDQAVSEVRTEGSYSVETPPWPGGIFPLKIEGLGDCEYKNDRSNPGALCCSERYISCQEDGLRWSGKSEICSNKY